VHFGGVFPADGAREIGLEPVDERAAGSDVVSGEGFFNYNK
jgi:hypothetical protein